MRDKRFHRVVCVNGASQKRLVGLGPVRTGRGAPCNRCKQIMGHTVVNGSVHTGCKQHQRVCTQICLRVLCERGLRAKKKSGKMLWNRTLTRRLRKQDQNSQGYSVQHLGTFHEVAVKHSHLERDNRHQVKPKITDLISFWRLLNPVDTCRVIAIVEKQPMLWFWLNSFFRWEELHTGRRARPNSRTQIMEHPHCGKWECSHSIASNIKGFACKYASASCVNWA